jgi:nucleotide-binding universal stress UspA family protein
VKKILFPTDGSAAAQRAASSLASLLGASAAVHVTLIVAVSPLNAENTDLEEAIVARQNAAMETAAAHTLAKAAEIFAAQNIPHSVKVVHGDPTSRAIAHEASSDSYDLIALGSRGMGMEKDDRHYVGSVTERVIRQVEIPVLVIPVHHTK